MFATAIGKQYAVHSVEGDIQSNWKLHPDEEQYIVGAKSLRYREDFLRGRTAARAVLKQMGFAADMPVLRGKAGEPLWPPGVVGSISHSGKTAVAVATTTSTATGVGIDIQDLSRRTSIDIARFVCVEAEHPWLNEDPQFREQRLLRIFGAKESIFKAVYPICGIYFGFQAATLSWNSQNSRFVGRLEQDLKAPFLRGYHFDTGSLFADNMVFSYTIIPPGISTTS